MSRRDVLIERILAQSDISDPDRPAPVVSLENFFEGNEDLGSIGCKLADHPGIARFFEVLCGIRARADVQDVLVEIYEIMEGEDEWPFSERVYVITSATTDDVMRWVAELAPSEVEEGWPGAIPDSAPEIQTGMKAYALWWD